MKTALLVIDVQNDSYNLNAVAAQTLPIAIQHINEAIAFFREKELPIIAIQHVNEAEGLAPGKHAFKLPKSLNILPSDKHVLKRYGNAFNKTDLLATLAEQDIDTVIVTGFCAEICVLSTYRGAEDVDLTPILLRDALASGSVENIRFVESINNIVSFRALKRFMN